MVDIMDKASRSKLMSGIRGKNTKIEIQIRKSLFARGFRYRLHVQHLQGKPDIVLPRYNALIFVHGCYWHGHDCHLFRLPSSNKDFWFLKIKSNQERDASVQKTLIASGWRIAIVWECAIRGRGQIGLKAVIDCLDHWLKHEDGNVIVKGKSSLTVDLR